MSWIDEKVAAELSPWQGGIERSLLEEACKHGEVNLHVKIVNGELMFRELCPGFQSRHRLIMGLFQGTLARHAIPNVEFIVNTGDFNWKNLHPFPVFIQSKPPGGKCFLMPDFSFGGWPEIGEPAWSEFVEKMQEAAQRVPWEQRTMQIYFRGAPTHHSRVRFQSLADRSELINIKVKNWAKEDESAADARTPLYEPFTDTCNFKMSVNLPGHGWCVRYKYLFTTGCAVFNVLQPDIQFWEGMLTPHEDFIPIDPISTDKAILSLLESCAADDNKLRLIAERGAKKVCSMLTMDAVYEYIAKLLMGYGELQRWSVD